MAVGQVTLKLYYATEAHARTAVDELRARSLHAEVVRAQKGWAAAVHVQAGDADLPRIRSKIEAIAAQAVSALG